MQFAMSLRFYANSCSCSAAVDARGKTSGGKKKKREEAVQQSRGIYYRRQVRPLLGGAELLAPGRKVGVDIPQESVCLSS